MALPEKALSELAEVKAAFDKAYEEYKHKVPTKICGPNLVGILNSAGFYQKKEWVGLTDEELLDAYGWQGKIEKNRFWEDTHPILEKARQDMLVGLRKVEAKLKEKNVDKTDYENIAERQTKALGESMKQTLSESDYKKNRAAYIEYLLMCVRLGDWHGVSDAANDLRVLEAKEFK